MQNACDHPVHVTIGDTDLMQNMYYANFYRLQGAARELWFRDCGDGATDVLRQGLVLLTRDASRRCHEAFHRYDPVRQAVLAHAV